MKSGYHRKLSGEVESDVTFVGGIFKNMHKEKRDRAASIFGHNGKTAVHGLLERNGELRAWVIPRENKKHLYRGVRSHVEPGSMLYTDASTGLQGA